MKKDTIQELLAKRQEGTLTDSELDELYRLTGRDEVMARADRRASGILRNRRIGAGIMGFAAVIAVGAVLLFSPTTQHAVETAATQTPAAPIEVPDMQQPPVQTTVESAAPQVAVVKQQPKRQPVTTKAKPTEPVVMCNSQCDADSVINDIWKFLTA